MTNYLRMYGERLVELGYTVLPIKPGSKRPDIKDWPRHATTVANVVAWYSNGRAQHGVGINARNTPAIDVDVLDPEVAQAMSDAIDAIFPGHSLLMRTGMAPKFLIPFQSDEPFRKLVSQTYTDGKNDHKVEILGDGQQFVAYAIHPGTNKPYQWFDGVSDSGIRESARADLPVLSRDDAQRVVDAFELLAAERVSVGAWSLKAGALPLETTDNARTHDDPFAEHKQPVGKTYREVEALLKRLPNDNADYDSVWFPTIAAVHHELGEEGEDLARAWSAKAEKHTDERFDITWNSLGRYAGPQRTLRSLMKGQPLEVVQEGLGGDFVPAAQFATEQKVEWHIKHVLPKKGLIVVYGAPGSSKSFFALDMVAHVARGLPWRGHRVRQSKVAYVAAEGVAGFGSRLAAYSKGHDVSLDDVPVFVRGGSLVLKTQVLALCDSINNIGGVGVVVIDTLAAVTPGENENVSEGMGLAIDAANRIINATGASVILIHHTNKTGEMRGWSGLLGAADNSIRIERKDDVRTAHIEKQKEGKDSAEYGYKLRVIDLYEDEDGDMVTSCVVEESEEIAKKPDGRKERKPRSGEFETSDNYAQARHFLQVIEELVGLSEANIDEADIISAIQNDEKANPTGQEDTPAVRSIKRTLHTLGLKGKIKKEGRWIRLCAD